MGADNTFGEENFNMKPTDKLIVRKSRTVEKTAEEFLILDVKQGIVYKKSECDSEMLNQFWNRYIHVKLSPELQKDFTQKPQGGEMYQLAISALESIVDPIGHMKKQLKEDERLDGMMAIKMAERPEFYQEIARKALKEISLSLPTDERKTFAEIKMRIGSIMFEHLKMNKEGTAIEANPATHRIAEWVYSLLSKKLPTDEEISKLLDGFNFQTSQERENAWDVAIAVREQMKGIIFSLPTDEEQTLLDVTKKTISEGMQELKIYQYQATRIEDAFRLVANRLKSHSKESCLDRDIMWCWGTIKNVLEGKINDRVERF